MVSSAMESYGWRMVMECNRVGWNRDRDGDRAEPPLLGSEGVGNYMGSQVRRGRISIGWEWNLRNRKTMEWEGWMVRGGQEEVHTWAVK